MSTTQRTLVRAVAVGAGAGAPGEPTTGTGATWTVSGDTAWTLPGSTP